MSTEEPTALIPTSIVLPVSVLALAGALMWAGFVIGARDQTLTSMLVKLDTIERIAQFTRDKVQEHDQRLLMDEAAIVDLKRHTDTDRKDQP